MSFSIFVLEDNAADAELLSEACREINFDVQWTRAADGVEAIEKLGGFTLVAGVKLVLLDLNVPKLNGSEVLIRLKGMEPLQGVPVIILTSSNSPSDQQRCRQANAYYSKSSTWKEFLQLARCLKEFGRTGIIVPDWRT